jgi:4-hydroxybenzoyl-CoA reductase subunit beta
METLPDFRLLRPRSVADALNARAASSGARFLAGGTDLLANMRHGLVGADTLIDLGAVAELKELRADAAGLRIGAGVTLETLGAHSVVQRDYSALAEAALSIAGPTHRAVGTVGGNLCLDTRCRFYNQSASWRAGNDFCMKKEGDACRVAKSATRCYAAFSGDLAPALMVLGAVAEIAGPQGRREMPLAENYADDGIAWLTLAPEELLVAVRVPAAGLKSGYGKIRVRAALDFPLAGVAVALTQKEGCLDLLRIAVTGTDSRPILIAGLDALCGTTPDQAEARLDKLMRKQIGPMETTVTSASYRRRVVPVLARRLLRRLVGVAQRSLCAADSEI